MTVPEQRHGATTEPLLRVEALSVRFEAFSALDAIDLDIRRGETVAFVGENGAGKSTLVRCIGGDMIPTSGRILIDGERLGSSPAAAARRGVTVVWQDLALCDNLDVASNLLLGSEGRDLMRSDARFHQPRSSCSQTSRSALRTRRAASPRFPAASASCSRSPARWRAGRSCSCSTSRPGARRQRIGAGRPDRGEGARARHDGRAGLARHRPDLPAGRPDRGASPRTNRRRRRHRRFAPRRRRRLHLRPAERFLGATAAGPPARPRRSARLGRPVVELAADPLGAGRRPRDARLCLHLVEGERLRVAIALGLPPALTDAWSDLPFGVAGGPVGAAAAISETVIDFDIRSSPGVGALAAARGRGNRAARGLFR